jgi:hypothetical protein
LYGIPICIKNVIQSHSPKKKKKKSRFVRGSGSTSENSKE